MEYIYAALLLHKLGKPINEHSMDSVLKAAGAEINESKVKSLIASLKGVDIDAEIANAVVSNASASAPTAKPAEEAPKEEKREAAAEGLSALFG
jgi:large subunit ribosomal protein L12